MKKITLVVVDDNLINRMLPSYILRPFALNVQVLECECGEDALRMLRVHQVTHVLLDISMPQMSGLDVLKEIKAVAAYSHIQLIAYTADVFAADADKFKLMGFDDVLLKPLKRAELLQALNIPNLDE
jgi:CheY-like chemotaxis protein